MKKQIAAILLACALAGTVAAPVEASWLGKIGKILGGSGTSSSSSGQVVRHDWQPLYKTDYYTVFLDMNTYEKYGKAQDRYVNVWLRRDYTAEGSQWLGDNSNGRVKPDTITTCVYPVRYGVTYSSQDILQPRYYDVNHHLIYKGCLEDMKGDDQVGEYVPGDMNEQIRDMIFAKVGWNY